MGQSGHVIESQANDTVCCHAFFWTGHRQWNSTLDPVLWSEYFYNFSELISDILAHGIKSQANGTWCRNSALIEITGPAAACGILHGSLSCGPNTFKNFANLFWIFLACYFNIKLMAIFCCNSTFIRLPRPWPVFWTGLGQCHFTWDPGLLPKYFHNFSQLILDTLALFLHPKPMAQFVAILPLLELPGRGRFFGPAAACHILHGTLCYSPNIFMILANFFRTVWPCCWISNQWHIMLEFCFY